MVFATRPLDAWVFPVSRCVGFGASKRILPDTTPHKKNASAPEGNAKSTKRSRGASKQKGSLHACMSLRFPFASSARVLQSRCALTVRLHPISLVPLVGISPFFAAASLVARWLGQIASNLAGVWVGRKVPSISCAVASAPLGGSRTPGGGLRSV